MDRSAAGASHDSDSVVLTARADSGAVSLLPAISEIPSVTSHEHWGSIEAIGWTEHSWFADLRAGIEPENASLADIVFDLPYSTARLRSKGCDLHAEGKARGFSRLADWLRKEPETAWPHFRDALSGLQSTGWFICLDEGFRLLYGTPLRPLFEEAPGVIERVLALDAEVRVRYARMITWHEEASRIAGIESVLRPVELEYGFREEKPGERRLVSPLLKIDRFCAFYRQPNERMRFCMEKTGIEPRSADTFREFLAACFALADRAGFVGTKQAQAYSRPLNFVRPRDSEVCFASTDDPAKQRVFGDFIIYECAELAEQRGWPHQIHTGTDNLPDSNPLLLRPLINAFPKVNFVLLHCWPYLEEAAWLAKEHRNVYLDPCWTPILNPEFLRRSLETYVGYLPDSKVMISHDATSVEMAAGALLQARRLLAEVLSARIARGELDRETALSLARAYFAETPHRLYGVRGAGTGMEDPPGRRRR